MNRGCEEKNEFVGVQEKGFTIKTYLTKGMKGPNEDEKSSAENEEVKCEIASTAEFAEIPRTCGGLVDGKDQSRENTNDSVDLMEKVVAKT